MSSRLKQGQRKQRQRWLAFLAALSFSLTLWWGQWVAAQPSAIAQMQQAEQLYQAGQFSQAAEVWQQAANAFKREQDPLNQAAALSNLSLTYQQLSQWPAAEAAVTKSLQLLQATPAPDRPRLLAATFAIAGKLQQATGKSAAALESWQQATHYYQTLGDHNAVQRSTLQQAQSLQDLGLYPKACQTLLSLLDLSRPHCQLSAEELEAASQLEGIAPETWLSLGKILRILGKFSLSEAALLTSWQLAQTQTPLPDLSSLYFALGNTAQALARRQPAPSTPFELSPGPNCRQAENDSAKAYYRQALACYQQAATSGDRKLQVQAQLQWLSLLIAFNPAQAEPLLPEINANLAALPLSHQGLFAQFNYLGQLLCLHEQRQGRPAVERSPLLQSCRVAPAASRLQGLPALETLAPRAATLLDQARSLGDPQAQSYAAGYLGAVHQQLNNLSAAQTATEQSLTVLSAYDTPALAYLWQWQLARLNLRQGQWDSANRAYTLAWETLQSLRSDLVTVSPEVQFNFRDRVEPVYRERVELLLRGDAPSQENLHQALETLETLQLAELNNFFQEACLFAQPQQIDQFDQEAAAIYPIILRDRLAVILARPQAPLSFHVIPGVGAPQIEETYNKLYSLLNPSIFAADPLGPHRQFYDWLVRPLEDQLAATSVQTLVFVLDGVLRGLPLAALHDGQHYLLEKYNLAIAPGLQLLQADKLTPDRLSVLLAGLSEGRDGFAPLPGVQAEFTGAAAIAAKTEMLLNETFTRQQLKIAIADDTFPIVHLATHGRFSSQAEKTFLLAWNERIQVRDLAVLLQSRRGPQQQPIELLVLSACETAAGDDRAALGLAGVAVRSGARGTLATLWAVDDASTAEATVAFYKQLRQGTTNKAAALRQAQLKLLQSKEYRHPYYWAPFVFIGNWL